MLASLTYSGKLKASLQNIAELFLAFMAFMLAGMVLWFQYRNLLGIPAYDDVFDRMRYYTAGSDIGKLFEYFIMPHNEHRITTTRVLAIFDEFAFHGKEYTQVFFANALQICSALVCFHVFFRNEIKALTLEKRLFLFAPLLLLFINANYLYTLFYPFQVQHAIMAFLCLVAAERISAFSTITGGPSFRDGEFWIPIIILAFLATFTLGNGPIILLATTAAAIVLRWRLQLIIVLGLLAFAHLFVVLHTMTPVGDGTLDIIKILKFCALYLGAPFLRFDPWPGGYVTYHPSSYYLAALMGMGIFGVGIGFGLLKLWKPRIGDSTAVFGLVILTIVIATSLAAAHSRAQFGVQEGTNKKYASFAGLGWVGVLAVLTSLLRQNPLRWRLPSVDWFYGGVLVFLLSLSFLTYGRETHIWQKFSERNWEGAIAAAYKINARDPLFAFSRSPEEIRKYVDATERLHVGAFAQFRYKWGDDANTLFAGMHEVSCRGSAQNMKVILPVDRENIFDVPGTPASINGWSWMDKDFAPASTIIAVDKTNRVVGLGRTIRTGEIAEEWLGQKFGGNVGWFGYARSDDLASLRFYAIGADNHSYCSLGAVGDVR